MVTAAANCNPQGLFNEFPYKIRALMKRHTAAKLLDWDRPPLFSPYSIKIHHFDFAPKPAALVPKAFCSGQDSSIL